MKCTRLRIEDVRENMSNDDRCGRDVKSSKLVPNVSNLLDKIRSLSTMTGNM